MTALVECVPNFSEGRDKAKVEAVVAAAKAVPGVTILDVETDADHNRCVLSFVATPQAAVEACFAVAKKSCELIDLNVHKGEHPRMGAVDVIPFIPVSGVSVEDCVKLAESLARRIGGELQIPAYLYDLAARVPERKDLANVRKGQFEGLRDLIGKDPSRAPDFGPNHIHPTAGAVAVGARRQIVNFNLNLDIADMAAGKDIAKRLRASGGGLPCVRAKEILLEKRGQVQISTVLTDYKTTSMRRVLAEAMVLSGGHGAKVVATEIVGLLPREALLDFALETLTLENFNPAVQILENRLEALGIGAHGAESGSGPEWLQASETLSRALASTAPVPGGGSAAAAAGAMGCALGAMAVGISLKSKKLEPAKRPLLERGLEGMEMARRELQGLASEDAESFAGFGKAMALPKDDPARAARIQEALAAAAEVPLRTAAAAQRAHAAAKALAPAVSSAVASDLNCALHLLKAAALCAAENVRINTAGLKDRDKARALDARVDAVLSAI
ncbi:MAG: glutamate formimidoyltransferase [Elusimicrobia bacterium]|nr:glutamate formimidoyltransferase [Elusimicrobiota bacterium]MDE2312806.1 glutamate formimidoyltransferase [Elusimicrobiota bacterium]